MKKTILMVAGEASGDLHGSHLARALLRKDGRLRILGVAGERMREAGVTVLFGVEELSMMGLEPLHKIRTLWRAYTTVTDVIRKGHIDLLVLIDFPDFNMRLAKVARKRGIPVIYYISPQVWAWRKGRVKTIARLVDTMILILPFEKEIYEKAGVPCVFVGHPLLDEMPPSGERKILCSRYGLEADHPIIGLLPGSRQREAERHLPLMLSALTEIRSGLPSAQFIVAVAPSLSSEGVKAMGAPWPADVRIVRGETNNVLSLCDLSLVASGTATLQAALLSIPMVIVYKTSFLTYLLGRLLVRVPHIGLANLIAGEEIVPELIQSDATPQKVAREALALMKDEEKRAHMRKRLEQLRPHFGAPGASARAAQVILQRLEEGRQGS